MTREKIIQGLYRGDSRAIKEAIKTLEKEPCEDAISKTSVFEILGNLMSIPYDFDRQINEKDVSESMDEIKALPSVTPTRKKEEWIPCDEKLPKNPMSLWIMCVNTTLFKMNMEICTLQVI